MQTHRPLWALGCFREPFPFQLCAPVRQTTPVGRQKLRLACPREFINAPQARGIFLVFSMPSRIHQPCPSHLKRTWWWVSGGHLAPCRTTVESITFKNFLQGWGHLSHPSLHWPSLACPVSPAGKLLGASREGVPSQRSSDAQGQEPEIPSRPGFQSGWPCSYLAPWSPALPLCQMGLIMVSPSHGHPIKDVRQLASTQVVLTYLIIKCNLHCKIIVIVFYSGYLLSTWLCPAAR